VIGGQAVRALGAMSGTSLDGVDAAEVVTDGETIGDFGPTGYRPYSAEEREVIRAALGRWPGEAGVAEAGAVVVAAHLDLLRRFPGAELVGFHGQTLAHDPDGGRTHQTGDGARLALGLGLPVVWDFRSADMAAGGQGAPLAPFFHFACARRIGATRPLAIVNLGGVGNITFVDPAFDRPEDPGALVAFDTGPANAPLNDLMQARRGLALDAGGALAAEGKANEGVIARFLAHPWFDLPPPKSLDRDAFAGLAAAVADLSDADAAATLTAAAAAAVARGLAHCPARPGRLLVTGGGRLNPVLMAGIAARADCPAEPVEAVGLDGDMLEAQAFAFLAVRVTRGLPTSAPGTTGCRAPVSGGRISRP
jgi:anhydro-N-acetylmuramic acid kinase